MKPILFKIVTPILSCIVIVLILEFVLSVKYPKNEAYFIWDPGLQYNYDLSLEYLGDTSDFSKVRYNSIGARSNEAPYTNAYKILAIGGSTTECIVIDQDKTWTNLLQHNLNEINGETWVGNFGKSGNETHHHILQLKELLKKDKLKDTKSALFLIGYNDAVKAIQNPNLYLNTTELNLKIQGFKVVPDSVLPFYRQSAIFKYVKQAKFKSQINNLKDGELKNAYADLLKKRELAHKVDILPNIDKALERYSSNIKTLISIAKTNNIVPVFITQPVIWRANLSDKDKAKTKLYFEHEQNYSIKGLTELMNKFNTQLKKVCQQQNVKCIDAASVSKPNWFYDDCHFTLTGSRELAKLVTKNMKD